MTTSTNTSGLPITQLGATIKSHLGIAGKYEGKAEEHYKSAGLHLVEAKARIAAGEYQGKFAMFLLRECNDLSSSRAYELIAIAQGTKTVEGVRAETAARKRAERLRKAAVRDVTERTVPAVSRQIDEPPLMTRARNAWAKIDQRLEESLQEDWTRVGEALSIGWHAHPTPKAFTQWKETHGFDNLSDNTCDNLMFYVENTDILVPLITDLKNPLIAGTSFCNAAKAVAVKAPEDDPLPANLPHRVKMLTEILEVLSKQSDERMRCILQLVQAACS